MEIKLPDIVALGVYDSNLAVKNKVITKNRKTTMFEIEIPTEKGGISYINSEKIPNEQDTIICAKPGQLRHTKLPYKCYYVHFIVTDGKLYDSLINIPNWVKTDNYEKYYEILKKMCEYYEGAIDSDEIILHSLTLKLIYTLIKDSKKQAVHENVMSNNHKTIENTIKYIKDNLTSDLSLETIADKAGFSPIHFHNVFKSSTSKTLREYVEEQRIKKAINMLITTDYTLAEIAYECGFSSQSYFSYAFKHKMGKTPKEYAKEVYAQYEK